MRRDGRRWAVQLMTVTVMGLGAGCASTTMSDTWVDPAAKGAGMSRVAVISLAPDEGMRRMVEDEFVKEPTNTILVPSYRILEGVDLKDREAVKARLRQAHFDGALVTRLAGVTERVVTTAGPYVGFNDYYDWAYASSHGYGLETQRTVRVISTLYSLGDGKLVWSGVSKTFEPASAKQVVNEVSHEVAKALQKDRLIL
jgi:hypothetical protein